VIGNFGDRPPRTRDVIVAELREQTAILAKVTASDELAHADMRAIRELQITNAAIQRLIFELGVYRRPGERAITLQPLSAERTVPGLCILPLFWGSPLHL
jgi:hypothetical protein